MSSKYPRTFHLPWSLGCSSDDKMVKDISSLINVELIITEKLDGSNCCLESSICYARTHSSAPTHESFDVIKSLHANVKHFIPESFQMFGENLYAQHSIAYSRLPSYFLLFGVRKLIEGANYWYSWEDVENFALLFNLDTVPVLFKGTVSSEKELKELVESFMIQPSVYGGIREGVVARVESEFTDDAFGHCVLKCVRANHVQTSEHWKDQEIIKNKLKL